ncbi:ATP-grasp domain-containing protein [Fluviibacter phosphoraccumulans]|uniref:ATP-grasp domain-containing protein n=1 Tax=Fluviibacter phosphoraccumulans TaxID=1751046 RepID=UPI0010BA74FF|nr:ATP-grasp domain-containing protein [Fluviibacter phosphoraccumulans]BCA66194.1 carbamoyl phosphate synthase large subunit [Fluviibacter phosphoraccumulans]
MKNILVLSAGRRVELVEAFKTELVLRGLDLKVLATDMKPEFSAACQIADGWIRAPRVTDPNYINFLLNLCKSEKISLVIPTIDTELLLLAQNRELFASFGIDLVVSDTVLVQKCRDKRLTAKLFSELNISTPQIFDRSNIKFPCFAKPYDGSCSVGAAPIFTREMLTNAVLADEKMMFMELIDASYEEYTVDAYYDREGSLCCFVPRQRIEVRAGEINKGVTRRHHVYAYLLDKLKLLQGARGCITLQLFCKANAANFAALEINPRFGGGFPLSYSAGANYPGWLIDEYLLDQQVNFKDDWEADLLMLRYDAKVLVHDVS